MSLAHLPLEVLRQVVSSLPLADVFALGLSTPTLLVRILGNEPYCKDLVEVSEWQTRTDTHKYTCPLSP